MRRGEVERSEVDDLGDPTEPRGAVAADGSVEIAIQVDEPTDAPVSNWLPAPAGRLCLVLRAYHPRPDLNVEQLTPVFRIE